MLRKTAKDEQIRFYVETDHNQRKAINTQRIRAIAEIIASRTGKELRNLSILEYGCNTGYAITELALLGNTAVGVDVMEEAIAIARESNGQTPNLTFLTVGDTLPFPDRSFDFVFSSEVIEHVPLASRGSYFSEFRRVMKDDGLGYVSYPNFLFPLELHYKIPFHHWYQRLFPRDNLVYEDIPTKSALRRELSQYFECVDISRDFLNSEYVQERHSALGVWVARLLSYTPFSAQDYLLLRPKP